MTDNLGVVEERNPRISTKYWQNPEHHTSLSPNNIYVTFTSLTDVKVDEIKKIELVDIGVNADRAEKYKEVISFRDYLGFMHRNYYPGKYLIGDRYQYDVADLEKWQKKTLTNNIQS